MFFNWDDYKFCLRPGRTDMRRGADMLTRSIKGSMKLNPCDKIVFLFCGGRCKIIKAVVWDENGFWLMSKKLYSGTYAWPENQEAAMMMDRKDVEAMLSGADIFRRLKTYPKGLKF